MPFNIFSKFSIGKNPKRSTSLSSLKKDLTDHTVEDRLNEIQKMKSEFDGGTMNFNGDEWATGKSFLSKRSSVEDDMLSLQETINYLRVENEVLLDMLTEKSADNILKDKQIKILQSKLEEL